MKFNAFYDDDEVVKENNSIKSIMQYYLKPIKLIQIKLAKNKIKLN